jgi:hypothetical protein
MSAAAQDHHFIALSEQHFRKSLPKKSAAAGQNNTRFHVRASDKRQAPLSQDRREAISR